MSATQVDFRIDHRALRGVAWFMGCRVIVQAFLRWSEKAAASDRAKAAKALGQAYLQATLPSDRQAGAYAAMACLLDDPSPKVRLALAESLAHAADAPRAIVLALAEDQPEIACPVILNSPVLRDSDLVELVGRGGPFVRAIIGARPNLSPGVCAALAEIGDECEISILLENRFAQVTSFSLRRIAVRFAENPHLRALLLDHPNLPADVRQAMVVEVGAALQASALVSYAMSPARAQRLVREATDVATMLIAADVGSADAAVFVEHLRQDGTLTPALLMNALCLGRLDFFAEAISNLSGVEERRVRSILATGRQHAVKALYHSAGLSDALLDVFLEATLLWRNVADISHGCAVSEVSSQLIQRFSSEEGGEALYEIISMIERIHMKEQRNRARSFATDLIAEAA